MKKTIILFLLGMLPSLKAQVGVGTVNPDASAALEVASTNQGFLPPRMTAAQRDAISSPAEGLVIYCTDCGNTSGGLQVFDGVNFKILKPADHYLGEFYQGGVIFYLWEDVTGQHGLIVSPVIIDSAQQWSNIVLTSSGATSSWDGKTNTQSIIAQSGHTNSAAKSCSDYSGGGFTDWYLPSLAEAHLLREAYFVVNKALSINSAYHLLGKDDNRYQETIMTSTEASPSQYLYLNLGPYNNGGMISKSTGYNSYKIRAIRSF